MKYEMNINRAYNLAFLSVHKLINDLNISDEFKAYLLDRYYYEYYALNDMSNQELDKLAFLVNYKYKDVNENCCSYIEMEEDKYNFIDELGKIEDVGVLINTLV